MVTLTCPHCQFSKDVPEANLPGEPRRLRCRQCGESFMFDPAAFAVIEDQDPIEPEPAQPLSALATGPLLKEESSSVELPPVIDLFSRSWQLYKQRIWLLLGIYIVSILMTMIPGIGAGLLVGITTAMSGGPGLGSIILLTAAVLLALLLLSWGMIAMVYATVDTQLGFKSSFGAAKENYWAFTWMFSLLAFVVGGGSLLVLIPGLVFATWFLFAQYILAVEGEGGMNSLLKSREYVRGYFWAVLLRLLTLWVSCLLLMIVFGWIPLVGDLLSLFLFPFTLIYQYLLYRDLREARRETLVCYWENSVKARWLVISALGYLVLPAAFWLAGGPAALSNWALSWQLKQGMAPGSSESWTPPAVIEEKLGKEPPAALKSSRKELNALLRQAHVEAPAGGISVGPAALVADRFWDDGSAPHLWLKVRLAALPNLELVRERAARVSIDRVEDGEGVNRYDVDSLFEKEFFQRVALQAAAPGGSYMEGIRDIYLRKGTDEDDLRHLSGRLQLALPVGIEVVELTPSMMGKDYTVAGHDIGYKRLEGPAVTIDVAEPEVLLQVVGYNASGKPLAHGGSNFREHDGLVSQTYLFQGEVFSVRLYVARKLVKKTYPFELKLAEN